MRNPKKESNRIASRAQINRVYMAARVANACERLRCDSFAAFAAAMGYDRWLTDCPKSERNLIRAQIAKAQREGATRKASK